MASRTVSARGGRYVSVAHKSVRPCIPMAKISPSGFGLTSFTAPATRFVTTTQR